MTKLSDETRGGKKNGRTGRGETGETEDLDAVTHERVSRLCVKGGEKRDCVYIHVNIYMYIVFMLHP